MHTLVSDFGQGLVDLEHLNAHTRKPSCCRRIVQIVFAVYVFIQSAIDLAIVLLNVNSLLSSGIYVLI